MGSPSDGAADLVEMGLHGLGVGIWHGKSRADAAGWADRPEQIDALVALVCRLTRTAATPGPLTHQTILLAYSCLVLEPDLDRLARRKMADVRFQRRGEVFLKAAMVSAFWPGWRGRALMCEKPIWRRILPIVRS